MTNEHKTFAQVCNEMSANRRAFNYPDLAEAHLAEVNALRAEVERLREALRGMVDGCSNAPMPAESFDMIPMAQARAALSK